MLRSRFNIYTFAEKRLGLSTAKEIFFGGDGGNWITEGIKDYFPKAKFILCLFHLYKNIKKSLSQRKEELQNLYSYIANNQQGIATAFELKRKHLSRAGAIEPNIDKTIAHRFKKRGMSWSVGGAQALLKIKETIINNEWDNWWYKNRNEKIEIKKQYCEPLSATQIYQNRHYVSPFAETILPALEGCCQDKPWVGILRELTRSRSLS